LHFKSRSKRALDLNLLLFRCSEVRQRLSTALKALGEKTV
jgi:hypothetical protein